MFDIESARELFAMLRTRFGQYSEELEKSTEDAIFIVLIANHLREWIAPGYNPSNNNWPSAKTDAERFSRRVYEHSDFALVRALANGTKHLKNSSRTDTMYFNNTMDDLRLGDVGGQPIMKGIPAAHFVDDRLLETVIDPVMKLYGEWFESVGNSN